MIANVKVHCFYMHVITCMNKGMIGAIYRFAICICFLYTKFQVKLTTNIINKVFHIIKKGEIEACIALSLCFDDVS